MILFSKIISVFKNPFKIFCILAEYRVFNWISDKNYLKLYFRGAIGGKLNLENPQTFNEKMQWLKLNDRNNEYMNMVDKFKVRDYISHLLGDEYLIPLLGVWNSFDDINFDDLPNEFVLKCTHDSGGIVICKDKSKINMADVKLKINKCLRKNFYWIGREWPYKNLKAKIIAEKLMVDDKNNDLVDYKFMCYNGKVKNIFTCTERRSLDGLKVTFFDLNWDVLPIERKYSRSLKEIKKPINFDKMIELAEILSTNIRFCRIDFYEINNRIYFGEITFYPGSGMEKFKELQWDYKLGSLIQL